MSEFNSLVPESIIGSTIAESGAPQAAAMDPGTDLAIFTDQAPLSADLGKLVPMPLQSSPPMQMYYNGDYLAWNDFSTTFPMNRPALWIERAFSWSAYATLPQGEWTRELLYVPIASPITIYEIYPGGYVIGYSLGYVAPGYYTIWYFADVPGRHQSMFATRSGYSNAVIIDVYSSVIRPVPKPTPDPKKECEARSSDAQTCEWRDRRCQCYMKPAPNPVAECEARSTDTQTCEWRDGSCQCYPKPVPNPVAECEANPTCDYIDGHCYCRGVNPEPQPEPEPMPGPVPNPNPEPGPFNPAPSPAPHCGSGCYWDGSQCVCTGLLTGGSSGGSSDDGDSSATA